MRLIHRLVCCGLVLAVPGLGVVSPAHADDCDAESGFWGGICEVCCDAACSTRPTSPTGTPG